MKTLAIIGTTDYPIPAIRGGAIQSLVTLLINKNEQNREFNIIVFTVYDKSLRNIQSKYSNTIFYFYKKTFFYYLIDLFDKCLRRLFKKRKPFSLYMRFVNKALNKLKVDSVIFETTYKEVTQIKKKNQNCLYYYHVHADYLNGHTPFIKDIALSIDCFIAISDFIKRQLINTNCIREEQIKVLRNCVDLDFVNATIQQTKLGFREQYNIGSEPIVAYCGRLSKEKGCLELIKAFGLIKAKATLVLIGGSNFSKSNKNEYVKTLIDESQKCGNRVVFTGYLNSAQALFYLSSIDIGVVPSICNEAASLSIIEFRALHKPTIATNIGGIPEYGSNESTLFVDYDDNFIHNLSSSMESLIRDNGKRNSMAKASSIGIEDYNADNYYANFAKIIAEDMF